MLKLIQQMKKPIIITLSLFLIISCSTTSNETTLVDLENNDTTFDWVVPTSEITGSNSPLTLNPSCVSYPKKNQPHKLHIWFLPSLKAKLKKPKEQFLANDPRTRIK